MGAFLFRILIGTLNRSASSANGEAAPVGGSATKKAGQTSFLFCGALPGTHPVAACRADFAHNMRSHRSAPLPSPLRFAASATGGAHLRGTQGPHQLPHGVRVSQIPSKQRKGTQSGALSLFGAPLGSKQEPFYISRWNRVNRHTAQKITAFSNQMIVPFVLA